MQEEALYLPIDAKWRGGYELATICGRNRIGRSRVGQQELIHPLGKGGCRETRITGRDRRAINCSRVYLHDHGASFHWASRGVTALPHAIDLEL